MLFVIIFVILVRTSAAVSQGDIASPVTVVFNHFQKNKKIKHKLDNGQVSLLVLKNL